MPVTFPDVRIGEPICCEALSVFPLFGDTAGQVDYLLSDEALGSESLVVEEVDEGGSVPDLLVENKGDLRVLFLEGEELIGAKQNRILNTSVLIAAKSKIKIPVSCVEAGRWGYTTRRFGSSGRHSPSRLRHVLKGSVSRALKAKRGHRSDQGEVWEEVSRQQRALGTTSGTSAMSDTFEDYHDRVTEFQQRLKYAEGASGVAVAVGDRVVAVDLFDKPATCQKVWDRLLSGFVLDALEVQEDQKRAEAADVERLLETVGGAPWEQAETVGEGQEYRAEKDHDLYASALTLEESLVHGSAMAGV